MKISTLVKGLAVLSLFCFSGTKLTGQLIKLSPAGGQHDFIVNQPVTYSLQIGPSFGSGNGNVTCTWSVSPSAGVTINPSVQIGPLTFITTTTITFSDPGRYTISCIISRGTSSSSYTDRIDLYLPPALPNLWAPSANGNTISSFKVINGAYAEGPATLFDAYPLSNERTAALGITDKPSAANGNLYWITNSNSNDGTLELYAATHNGTSRTLIGTWDLNGAANASNLYFVRLGMGPDGRGWILAGDGTSVYLARFTPNGTNPVSIVVEDPNVTVVGGSAATFTNGDLCVSGDGTIYALANDGAGTTQIYIGKPNGISTVFTKYWDLIDFNRQPFTSRVNGAAFDELGSIYISTEEGLYFIDQSTTNRPAGLVSCFLVQSVTGLTDLATNFFPTSTRLNPIPVKLTRFAGNLNNNIVTLNWTSDNEESFSHYEVERSTDGINFIKTGSLPARGNNSGSKTEYEFSEPAADINTPVFYYRLKAVDIDGKFTYSPVIALNNDNTKQAGYSAYPNPFVKDIKVQVRSIKAGTVTLRLRNSSGQLVTEKNYNVQAGENTLTADNLEQVSSGTYFLEIITDDKRKISKLVKE